MKAGVQPEEEVKIPNNNEKEEELVLDGGFCVPHTNSFGHGFRSNPLYHNHHLFNLLFLFIEDLITQKANIFYPLGPS